MSLLGKILAFLNVLGAAALIYTGAVGYAKRQAGAYALFQADLILNGLPVDEQQHDPQGRPIHLLISDKLKQEMFAPVGGAPVTTQKDEYERVRAQVKGKSDSLTDAREKMLYQAKVLLPLTDDGVERQWLLAYRTHLATPQALDLLKARYQKAFRQATAQAGKDVSEVFQGVPKDERPALARNTDEAFRAALDQQVDEQISEVALKQARPELVKQYRDLISQPSAPFTHAFLKELPADPEKARAANFDATFTKAFEANRAWLDARFNEALSEARPTTAQLGGKPVTRYVAGRRAIASTLVRLALVLAEEEALGPAGSADDKKLLAAGPIDSELYQKNLANTAAYKKALRRAQVVVGLKAEVDAVSERAVALRKIALDLGQVTVDERGKFLTEHQRLVEAARQRAFQLASDTALLARAQALDLKQDAQVKRRADDVRIWREELEKSQAETAKFFEKLEGRSQTLFRLRIRLRDAQLNNEVLEQHIRYREAQVRELEQEARRAAPNRPQGRGKDRPGR